MIKLLKYAGNKEAFTPIINTEINRTTKSIYVEPFLGSGAIFNNLEKEFDKYIINDIDPAICKIFTTIKNSNHSDFIEFYDKVLLKFGDIKKSKESYYEFRNSFNKKLWKTNTDEEGFCLILLYNACINSMARWSPNGFNQSYGNRIYLPIVEHWNSIKSRLERTEIHNKDFFELLADIENIDDCIMFLDPPYISAPTSSYKTISSNFYKNFLEFCRTTKANILYTDVDHNELNMYKITLRENMRNISPNRKEELKAKEVMFYNY